MFRTELTPSISKEKIKTGNKIYLIGSCFASNIGNLLKTYKFDVVLNPFGVIYNPHSIFKLLVNSLSAAEIDEKGLFENQAIYRHFDCHSDISARSQDEFYHLYAQATSKTREHISKAEWIIISLGTSIVYEHQDYHKIVANCHKLPGREFTQRMLSPEEIIQSFDTFYTKLKEINKNCKVILTVSPVRHVKSTLEKNALSKAILRYAVSTLSDRYARVMYFPSFEIMMDDLRDYRFYQPDMIHPNEVAINYIWKKFMETYFDPETKEFIQQWALILKAIGHKPFFPGSATHQHFIKETIRKLKSFESRIDIQEELVTLENQLL
jgi:hypothetical protein